MDRKTARKYRDTPTVAREERKPRSYRTRHDPFAHVWEQVQRKLEADPALKAYALFDWLQMTHLGEFAESMRRTFERRVAQWKKLHGPGKNVVIEQVHRRGRRFSMFSRNSSDSQVAHSSRLSLAHGDPGQTGA